MAHSTGAGGASSQAHNIVVSKQSSFDRTVGNDRCSRMGDIRGWIAHDAGSHKQVERIRAQRRERRHERRRTVKAIDHGTESHRHEAQRQPQLRGHVDGRGRV